jgi:hypothetical protein
MDYAHPYLIGAQCILSMAIVVLFDTCVLEMTYVEGPIGGILAACGCAGLAALLYYTVPWPNFVLILSIAVHLALVLWMARLDPQRTDKAAFSMRMAIPVEDARVATAFFSLSPYARRQIKTVEELDTMLKQQAVYAKRKQEEHEEKRLFQEL